MMNKKEFDYLGITKWHEKGYTGKGITLAELEVDVDTSLPFLMAKLLILITNVGNTTMADK